MVLNAKSLGLPPEITFREVIDSRIEMMEEIEGKPKMEEEKVRTPSCNHGDSNGSYQGYSRGPRIELCSGVTKIWTPTSSQQDVDLLFPPGEEIQEESEEEMVSNRTERLSMNFPKKYEGEISSCQMFLYTLGKSLFPTSDAADMEEVERFVTGHVIGSVYGLTFSQFFMFCLHLFTVFHVLFAPLHTCGTTLFAPLHNFSKRLVTFHSEFFGPMGS